MKYKLEEESGVTDKWLFDNVVCKLTNSYPPSRNRVAKVLALPLLWACLDPDASLFVPSKVKDRITTAYAAIKQLPGTVNPVKRVPLAIFRAAENLVIQELVEVEGDGNNTHPHHQQAHQANEHGVQIMFSKLHQMEKAMKENKESLELKIDRQTTELRTEMNRIGRNVQRLALLPAHRAQTNNNAPEQLDVVNNGNEQAQEVAFATTLSSNPKDLYTLWQEYEFGIDGRKPAKDFNATEQGQVKHKFFRRKVFWDVVVKLVNAGCMAEVAIDRVYNTYGVQQSITTILSFMIRDKRQNITHPQLQI